MFKTEYIKLGDIVVPQEYLDSTPTPRKVESRMVGLNLDCCTHPVFVDKDNTILDGYATYVAYCRYFRERGLVDTNLETCLVPVRKLSDDRTMYFFGHHKGQSKQYVWELDRISYRDWTEQEINDDFHIGDLILVETRKGTSVARVDSMMWLDTPPVCGVVRRANYFNRDVYRRIRQNEREEKDKYGYVL